MLGSCKQLQRPGGPVRPPGYSPISRWGAMSDEGVRSAFALCDSSGLTWAELAVASEDEITGLFQENGITGKEKLRIKAALKADPTSIGSRSRMRSMSPARPPPVRCHRKATQALTGSQSRTYTAYYIGALRSLYSVQFGYTEAVSACCLETQLQRRVFV